MTISARLRSIGALGMGLSLAACTGATITPKGGGPPPPRELVLVSFETAATPLLTHFAERVEAHSRGALVIKTRNGWGGDTVTSEADAVRSVASGEVDLGFAGTRVFDLLGVDSLRPLHLPFLVDSYPAQAEVVLKGTDRLLADVPDAGVEPLALLADQLRFSAGADRPILALGDWEGRKMSAFPSDQQGRGLAALGAKPISEDEDRQTQVVLGAIDSAETGWPAYAFQQLSVATPYVTPNVVLWPRTTVLFANPESIGKLSDSARAWLAKAAAETRDRSIDDAGADDDGQLVQQCDRGARIALATTSQRDVMRAAVQPVYDQLLQDPELADTVKWLEGLRSRQPAAPPPDVPDECRYDPSDPVRPPTPQVRLSAPGDPGELPLGTYRVQVTPDAIARLEDKLEAPVWSTEPAEQHATLTWVLKEGTWTLRIAYADGGTFPYACEGVFAVRAGQAWFTTVVDESPGQCAPPTWTAHWTLDGHAPNWSDVAPADFGLSFDVLPWQRIS